MRILWLLIILLIFSAGNAPAQYYVKGQEPATTRWLETKTPEHVRLIFPEYADSMALVFGKLLDRAYSYYWDSLSIQKRFKPVPVIVHPNSVLSNGFVSWAPRRMEVVTIPDNDSDPLPWLSTLAFHETAHVAQVVRLNQGFFRGLSYIFGQQAPGAAVGFVPLWFIEGEAIANETSLTLGGRGRDADFYQFYRSHLIANNGSKYTYNKWLMSSYRDYIPNHYHFGYQLVGYANMRFGKDVWNKTLTYVANHSYTLFPFYFGFKKQTGLSRKALYNSAFNHLDSVFTYKQKVEHDDFNDLHIKNKRYSEYHFPHTLNDSTIVCYKKDIGRIPEFVAINLLTGKEVSIYSPGVVLGNISYGNGYALWSQYNAHPRWDYVSWAELWVLDISNRKARRITSKTRFFSPVFTPDGNILAVEHSPSGRSILVQLDRQGNRLTTMDLGVGFEPKEIAVSETGEVVVRASTEKGAVLIGLTSLTDTPKIIWGPYYQHISNVKFVGNQLMFSMNHEHRNEIFYFNEMEFKTYMVSNSIYGINNFTYFNDSAFVVTSYSAKGIYPTLYQRNTPVPINEPKYCDGLFEKANLSLLEKKFDVPPFSEKIIKRHKAISNMFNFHSWAPFYFNPDDLINGPSDIFPGITLLSQNLTSTAVTSLGYSYSNTSGYHAHVQLMGWLPVISAGIDVGNTFPKYYGGQNDQLYDESSTRVESSVRVSVPLTLSVGEYVTRISPGAGYSFVNNRVWNPVTGRYLTYHDAVRFSLGFYSLKRMAHRDLRSSLGFYFLGSYVTQPSVNTVIGDSYLLRSSVYLPGIMVNHSLLLSAQHEKHKHERYFNTNRAFELRGMPIYRYSLFNSLNVDYTFPLAYPDLSLGSLVYIKRIFINIFSDNALIDSFIKNEQGSYSEKWVRFGSNGAEIYSDMNFFRTRYEFRLGYRVGLVNGQNAPFHSVLVSFNMNSIYGFIPNRSLLQFDL